MLDLETLRLIWWLLLGILLIGFAITDGFDLGLAVLFPVVAKTDLEREVVLSTIRPIWEGNQVWIIAAAGSIFAAWPLVYAVSFSVFYFIILLLLLTLGISRPVSFKYRNKLKNSLWRSVWDRAIFIGGLFPSLIFGFLIGNVMQGLPFHFDEQLRISYEGSFWDLFNPFAGWCAFTSLVMLVMHGGIYLAIKTEAPLAPRALHYAKWSAAILILLFAGGSYWLAYQVKGYTLTSFVSPQGFANPLHKEVVKELGAWLHNYSLYPLILIAPSLGLLSPLLVILSAQVQALKLAFVCSALSIIGIISSVG
ncbi:MAG TPA: cytochrome d ubiquinol oxidase subunit II, partial [Gammaproteobacteria bacterium]|nr:cytochrome d ubiquinol oxidase subunit II [Gammaproteobacteria bacterium]